MDDGGGRRAVDTIEGQDTHREPPSLRLLGVVTIFLGALQGQLTMVGLSGGQDWLGGKSRRSHRESWNLIKFPATQLGVRRNLKVVPISMKNREFYML